MNWWMIKNILTKDSVIYYIFCSLLQKTVTAVTDKSKVLSLKSYRMHQKWTIKQPKLQLHEEKIRQM